MLRWIKENKENIIIAVTLLLLFLAMVFLSK